MTLVAPTVDASNSSTSQLSDDYYSCVPEEEEDDIEEFIGGWEDTECDEEIKRITGGRSQAPSPEPTLVLPQPQADTDSPKLAMLPVQPASPEPNLPEHDSSQQALLPTTVGLLRASSLNLGADQHALLLSAQSAVEDDDNDPPCDGDQFV